VRKNFSRKKTCTRLIVALVSLIALPIILFRWILAGLDFIVRHGSFSPKGHIGARKHLKDRFGGPLERPRSFGTNGSSRREVCLRWRRCSQIRIVTSLGAQPQL
jgi:hypothetical protein